VPGPDRRQPGTPARCFGARATDYDRRADLQRHAAARLAGLLVETESLPRRGLVAEIGCGTGLLTELLAPGLAAGQWLATDIAPEMLAACRAKLGGLTRLSFAVLDGERPVFAKRPAAIVSNMALQWLGDPPAAVARLARQASLLAFSLPLAGSFPEWEQAFAAMGRTSGLRPMPTEAAVREALASAGAGIAVWETEELCRFFPNPRRFVESFRNIGADSPRPGYRPAPIKPLLRRFANGLEVTVRILYCIARGKRK
jgi:malonyl-CoA O-methyltransferase